MKVVFTQCWWMELDSIDEAAEVVEKAEPKARETWRKEVGDVLQANDLTEDDVEGRLGFLGTSFWAIDEERAPLS